MRVVATGLLLMTRGIVANCSQFSLSNLVMIKQIAISGLGDVGALQHVLYHRFPTDVQRNDQCNCFSEIVAVQSGLFLLTFSSQILNLKNYDFHLTCSV